MSKIRGRSRCLDCDTIAEIYGCWRAVWLGCSRYNIAVDATRSRYTTYIVARKSDLQFLREREIKMLSPIVIMRNLDVCDCRKSLSSTARADTYTTRPDKDTISPHRAVFCSTGIDIPLIVHS